MREVRIDSDWWDIPPPISSITEPGCYYCRIGSHEYVMNASREKDGRLWLEPIQVRIGDELPDIPRDWPYHYAPVSDWTGVVIDKLRSYGP